MVVLAGTAAAAGSALAQTHPPGRTATGLAMVAPPTPDADALAEQMRILAKDPKNVDALIRAGELTLTLGDPTAAAVLFSRAEKIEPNNPRMQAGMAATLVRMERPGQALRLFAQAERGGYDVEEFAADRGLAYDLVGAQERAQRDYRLALEHEQDDETLRRYALSLGISGQTEEAMQVLDPLLRKRDRAAWRDRAFIYAMNGKPDKAEEIAAAMMPGPVSEGLAPFFRRLDELSPVDRAFAVHFGELNPSPARLADAKLAPPLPPLTPEPKPVQLASATPEPTAPKPRRPARRKEAKPETRVEPGRTAMASPVPVVPAPATVTPERAAGATQSAGQTAASNAVTTPAPAPVQLAGNDVAASSATTPEPAPPSAVGGEDSILERIIANITVPASELGPSPAPGSSAPVAPVAAAGTGDVAEAQAALEAAAAKAEAERLAAVKEAARRKAEREAKAEADRKAAEKRAAEEKAAAAKKAAEEKAAAKKKAAEEKKAKAEPSRFWVQVAGGANEKTLDRAFAEVVGKAPALMKGKQGWWTPLNATNRVLTGPFKSEDAAQDFVNKLAGTGISAFPFTSRDGQKITKLPAK